MSHTKSDEKVKGQIMFVLRVLGHKKAEGLWAAHCLETDLVGYGRSFKKAMAELEELTAMQISFAHQKKQPALLDHPASADIHELYNTVLRKALQTFPKTRKEDSKRRLGSIPLIPSAEPGGFSIVSAQTL